MDKTTTSMELLTFFDATLNYMSFVSSYIVKVDIIASACALSLGKAHSMLSLIAESYYIREELRSLYRLSKIARMVKPRKLKWVRMVKGRLLSQL